MGWTAGVQVIRPGDVRLCEIIAITVGAVLTAQRSIQRAMSV
jgi:hypothetical protein